MSRHRVYVADSINGRVQVLDRLGTFIDTWSLPDGGVAVLAYFHPNPAGQVCPTLIGGNPPPIGVGGQPVYDQPVVLPVAPGSDDY